MRTCLFFLMALLLSACQTSRAPESTPSPPATQPITTVNGEQTAAALTARYNDTRADCGAPSKPAFLCTGVILRITTYSPNYDSWDPSPTSVRLGGQSFSFIRKDSKTSRLASNLNNGYILYPIFGAPPDKMDPDVLCIFPIDGWTNDRSGQRCGPYSDNNPTSKSCDLQNITTAQQWINLYTAQGQQNQKLCSFNVRDDRNQLAGPAFYAGVLAKSQGSPTDKRFTQHNELVLKTWAAGQGAVLPIQAFFYLNATGLVDAKKDKANFLAKTRISLPLIKITMPNSQSEEVRFEYVAGDN